MFSYLVLSTRSSTYGGTFIKRQAIIHHHHQQLEEQFLLYHTELSKYTTEPL